MAKFSYIATNETGKSTQGIIESTDKDAAFEMLHKQNLRPISVQPAKKSTGLGAITIGRNKVKSKDLVIFTRQLSTLVNAGVPLVRSISTLQTQTESDALKKQLGNVVKKVEAGGSLGDALAEYPRTFSSIYVNMVRAGEEGGILDDVLSRLAIQQEKDAAIRGKIKGAMVYPSVIATITFAAFFFLMTTIVPKIGGIIKSLGGAGAQLPIYTRVLLSMSDTMKKPIFIVSVVIVLPILIYLFRRYIRTKNGRYHWHSALLRTPILKMILTKIAIARFARTFASLMSAGVSIVQAIKTTAGSIGNAVIEKELLDSARAVEAGEQLSAQLENSKHFPPLVSQMLAVGEETGQTDQIILKVAEFYEEEVDTVIGSLASIIEPVMIIVLGSMVGVIAASVFGPISQISTSIH